MSTNKPADLFTLEAAANQLGLRYGDVGSQTLIIMKQCLNLGLIKMNDYGHWRNWNVPSEYSFDTEANTSKYSLCASVKSITALYTKNPDRKLRRLNDTEFRRYVPDETDVTGEPTHYYEAGYDGSSEAINVILHPVPSSVITVHVDGDIQVPLLTQDKDDVRRVSYLPQNLLHVWYDVAFVMAEKILDGNYAEADLAAEKALMAAYEKDQTQPDERIIVSDHYGGSINDHLDPMLPPDLG